MGFIEVNGAALRSDLVGSGAATLVLIHEMGGTLESWDLVLPNLSAQRRVLRYDTRGAGLSQKVRGTLSVDTMGTTWWRSWTRSALRARWRSPASPWAAALRCVLPCGFPIMWLL
jgi:pimeloyl-ACP methyl ester carboxylesterase